MSEECRACGATVKGVVLCRRCGAQLAEELRAIPELMTELEVTVTKQARIAVGGKRAKGSEAPLPFHAGASDLATRVRGTVGSWMFRVADWVRLPPSPASDAGELALWLVDRPLSTFPDAGHMAHDIRRAVDDIRRIIDRPEPDVSLGDCDTQECGAELRVVRTAPTVDCWQCGRRYDVTARKDDLLNRAGDTLATAADIAVALNEWVPNAPEIRRASIDGWAARGRLEAKGRDRSNRVLYRFGDARDLVLASMSRWQERSA